jgi:hypothetical protein
LFFAFRSDDFGGVEGFGGQGEVGYQAVLSAWVAWEERQHGEGYVGVAAVRFSAERGKLRVFLRLTKELLFLCFVAGCGGRLESVLKLEFSLRYI